MGEQPAWDAAATPRAVGWRGWEPGRDLTHRKDKGAVLAAEAVETHKAEALS